MKPLHLKYFGLAMLWIIHIAAFIGIKIGYTDFFLPLSSLNLWFISLLLIWFYPIRKWSQIIIFLSIAFLGFLAEAIGVATGQVFGEYAYGENLGFKILDVPIIIGINWAVLSFVCSGLAKTLPLKSLYIQAIFASALMLIFDFFIEQSAPNFDFWAFNAPTVPLQNYVVWFILAYIFNLAVLKINHKNDTQICFHIYLVQFLFFMMFYVF